MVASFAHGKERSVLIPALAGTSRDRMPERSSRIALSVLTLTLLMMDGACAKSGIGANCSVDADCNTTFVCIAAGEATGRCMRTCESGTRLCSDGLVCMAFGERNACYLGGRVGYGEACTSNFACEAGTVCPDAERVCSQACGAGLDVCELVQACTDDALVGPYCTPNE